jgi:hypothetical protein
VWADKSQVTLAPQLEVSTVLAADQGPTFAASGVVTAVARPMNLDSMLLPELSTATPIGVFSEP